MGLLLKQSTAVDLLVGPFVDEDDGKTLETGLTITQAEVRLSKNGGNMAQKNEATALSHDELGMYVCKLDATDTNTLGRLQVTIWEDGALIVYHEFMVVTANYYDSVCGSDVLQSDLTQIGGVAQSATDLKDFADTGYNPATHKVAGVVLTDTTTAVTNDVGITQAGADKVWGTAARALTDKAGFTLSAAGIDSIWDEPMAGHITADTPAYVLRSLQSIISVISLAQAGAAGSITLAAASSAVNDYYKGQTICIVTGTGAGQARACYGYNGATKVALTRPNWATAPDNTSYYAILNVGSSIIAAIEDTAVDSILDEVVDANAPANANSLRETVNLIAGIVAGKSSGGGTATIKFRDLGDTKDRQTATVTAVGDRTAVTVDGT
jgi:hypothetical protein